MSVPHDVSMLLPRRKKDADDAEGGAIGPDDLAPWILRTVVRMRQLGHADAAEMSMTRLAFACAVDDRARLAALRFAAIAAKVGQSDEKGWKAFEGMVS